MQFIRHRIFYFDWLYVVGINHWPSEIYIFARLILCRIFIPPLPVSRVSPLSLSSARGYGARSSTDFRRDSLRLEILVHSVHGDGRM